MRGSPEIAVLVQVAMALEREDDPEAQELLAKVQELARRELLLEQALAEWHPEAVWGGLAAGYEPEDFPRPALRAGVAVEMEHTPDAAAALDIAMDHLVEDIGYYEKLASLKL